MDERVKSDQEMINQLALQEAHRCGRDEPNAADMLIGVMKYGRCDEIFWSCGIHQGSLFRAARDTPLGPRRHFTTLSMRHELTRECAGSHYAIGGLEDYPKPDAVVPCQDNVKLG